MTLYFVVKFNDSTPAADQFIFDARSDSSKSVRVFTDFSNSDRLTLDCGGTPIVLTATYTTDIQVITVQQNGDSTTTLTSSVLGTVSGDAGTETLDFGTFFADLSAGNTSQMFIGEGLGYSVGHTASQLTQNQNVLTTKWTS